MKIKKIFGVMLLGFMAVLLVACGQKSAEDIMKTELKDSYTGYSKSSSYQGLMFIQGGDVLEFNKKENSITNSNGEKIYFSVLGKNDIPSDMKGVITSLESDLKDTDNFTIITGRKPKPTVKDSEGAYQIALSDGGKKIRIFELSRSQRDYGYYDFKGQIE